MFLDSNRIHEFYKTLCHKGTPMHIFLSVFSYTCQEINYINLCTACILHSVLVCIKTAWCIRNIKGNMPYFISITQAHFSYHLMLSVEKSQQNYKQTNKWNDLWNQDSYITCALRHKLGWTKYTEILSKDNGTWRRKKEMS